MLAFKENVMQDVAQRKNSLKLVLLVYYNKSVYTGLANRVKDGVQSVVQGAGIDSGIVLVSVRPITLGKKSSNILRRASGELHQWTNSSHHTRHL